VFTVPAATDRREIVLLILGRRTRPLSATFVVDSYDEENNDRRAGDFVEQPQYVAPAVRRPIIPSVSARSSRSVHQTASLSRVKHPFLRRNFAFFRTTAENCFTTVARRQMQPIGPAE